jgi:hypothetical protein
MIINPQRVTATPPTERTDGAAVDVGNITLELGGRQGDAWSVLADENHAGATRDGGQVIFELYTVALPADIPIMLGVRAVEARPDLVTDEFPNGVDLYSTWAEGGLVVRANPPQAPAAVEVSA